MEAKKGESIGRHDTQAKPTDLKMILFCLLITSSFPF